jgi:hypothetical protein
VIKYTNATVNVYGAISCQTAPYRPAIITSKDDNTVGETITGSTGSPTTGATTYLAFSLNGASTSVLDYFRFEYAGTAISWDSEASAETNVAALDDCQFLHCGTVVGLMDYYNDNTLKQRFENVLISQCDTVVENLQSEYYGSGIEIVGQNMTVDQATDLIATYSNDNDALSSSLVNSILTDVRYEVYYMDIFQAALGFDGEHGTMPQRSKPAGLSFWICGRSCRCSAG